MLLKCCKLVSIEGNIGSGKSTLLKQVTSKYRNMDPVIEPVAQWSQTNLLKLYYQDPHRYGFTFQTFALFSRLRTFRNAIRDSNANVLISERSIEADKEVFAKLLHRKGFLNQTEWKLYEYYYNGYQDLLAIQRIDKFVYLRSSPEVCMQRIGKRGRPEEKNQISLEYLSELNEQHENWLKNREGVLVLDGNIDFEQSDIALQKMLKSIQAFVN